MATNLTTSSPLSQPVPPWKIISHNASEACGPNSVAKGCRNARSISTLFAAWRTVSFICHTGHRHQFGKHLIAHALLYEVSTVIYVAFYSAFRWWGPRTPARFDLSSPLLFTATRRRIGINRWNLQHKEQAVKSSDTVNTQRLAADSQQSGQSSTLAIRNQCANGNNSFRTKQNRLAFRLLVWKASPNRQTRWA